LEFYYWCICYFTRYCICCLSMVVITVCFMSDIHSAIQLTSFLDEGRGMRLRPWRGILMMMNTKLMRLMEDDHIAIFLFHRFVVTPRHCIVWFLQFQPNIDVVWNSLGWHIFCNVFKCYQQRPCCVLKSLSCCRKIHVLIFFDISS
jgi:hypothetical protein